MRSYTFSYSWICIFVLVKITDSGGNNERNSPQLEECTLTEPEIAGEFYNITNIFENIFNEAGELKKIHSKKENDLVNAIILIGNTGAGKSTLAHFLSGDYFKLKSLEINPESGDYIIVGGDLIGKSTTNSETFYPNLLLDSDTGIYICDNPGFQDTRSPIHEIIAAASMKTVLEKIKNIKLVLTVNYGSLRKGSYRADFMNLLEQTVIFVKNVEKYKNSIFLVATKVENSLNKQNGHFKLFSDENIKLSIYNFLNETKISLALKEEPVYSKIVQLIDQLMQINSTGDYEKIKLFRKPMESGQISENVLIQKERKELRDALFTTENFIKKSYEDFGFSISPNAKLYVNKIFAFKDKYMNSISKHMSQYLLEGIKMILQNISNFNQHIKTTDSLQGKISTFRIKSGLAEDPNYFVEEIKNFSHSNGISYPCNLEFNEVKFLSRLQHFLKYFHKETFNEHKGWNSSFISISDFLEDEKKNYYLLREVCALLSNYDFQKKKNAISSMMNEWWQFEDSHQNIIDEKSFNSFLSVLALDKQFESILPTQNSISLLYQASKLFIKTNTEYKCMHNELIFYGFIIRFQEINKYHFGNCANFMTLKIFAMHTLFIDKDLNDEELKGKRIVIAAPIWNVVGSRTINLDGKTVKYFHFSKASYAEIGKNGKSGGNGGIFVGFADVIENRHNLVISAKGGDGQDGQDGGDGYDGLSGRDGAYYNPYQSSDEKGIYIVYNKYEQKSVYDGSKGMPGGDSGAGGRGGNPGKSGSISVYQSSHSDKNYGEITIMLKDGKKGNNGLDGRPGEGGMGGCKKIISYKRQYVLFIPVSTDNDHSYGNCLGRSRDGNIKDNDNYILESVEYFNHEPLAKCSIIENYKNIYDNYFKIAPYDELAINFMKKTKCLKE